MPVPNVKTIRGSSHPLGTGDFTTIQAWEDWADNQTNPHQWAECYSGFDLGTFTLSGWASTPTTSGYPRIFASSGEQHWGSLTQGPIIAPASGSSSSVNTIAVNYSQISGLGSMRGFHANLNLASNVLIEKCWAQAEDSVCFKVHSQVSSVSSSGNVVKNCLAIGSNGHDIGFELGGENMLGGMHGIKCYNNTAYAHRNTGFRIWNTVLPGFGGGSNTAIHNCISLNSSGKDYIWNMYPSGLAKIISSHNISSDGSSSENNFSTLATTNAAKTFSSPHNGISFTTGSGNAVSVVSSGDFRLLETSYAIDRGTTISEVKEDIRETKRPVGVSYDIGAFEFFKDFYNTITLYTTGPNIVNNNAPLMLAAAYEASGVVPFYAQGHMNASGIMPLYIGAGIPISSGIDLSVFAQNPRRTGTLYISAGEITQFETSVQSLQKLSSSGTFTSTTVGLFLEAKRQASSGDVPLTTLGFSGIIAPNSWTYLRDARVNSDNYIPSTRKSTLFIESEHNCLDGSLYKFDNNVNDNSSDYNFKLSASGFLGGVPATDVTPMVESGLYQTTTRFPSSSATGSGAIRFTGGTGAGIKMINNNTYYGTVLTQSGSPSMHDQHRVLPHRRGVATSFWINKTKGIAPGTITALGGIRGVVGNLQLPNGRFAASGQWGIYYVPHGLDVKASGTTPFNSLQDSFFRDSEGRLKIDLGNFAGIIPYVNTTAGGRMSRLMRVDSDGDLIMEHVPDTMIPLDADRWYYMQFWIDQDLDESYIRIASPAKGHPGESGYRPEIKPITDKSQKWKGYEVKTDTNDLKLKVGGGLYREVGALPYYNLGYNVGTNDKTQEEFLMDELVVSNKVCSKKSMENTFDKNYENYTKQFLSNNKMTLFIDGV